MGKKLDALLHTNLHSAIESEDPRKMNDKAHNKSPFGEEEPSTKTDFK